MKFLLVLGVLTLASGLAMAGLPNGRVAIAAAAAASERPGLKLALCDALKQDDETPDSNQAPDDDPLPPAAKASPPDDGNDNDVAPQPDEDDPPGCVFQKKPLELLV